MSELIDGDTHFSSLAEKHRKLEEAIAEENARPLPDELKLHALKREKLRLKDEMARAKNQGGH